MISDKARQTISAALQYVAYALFALALWFIAFSWQINVVLFVTAVALIFVSLWVEPPKRFRAPRGGPMVDPEHTIVISKNKNGPN